MDILNPELIELVRYYFDKLVVDYVNKNEINYVKEKSRARN